VEYDEANRGDTPLNNDAVSCVDAGTGPTSISGGLAPTHCITPQHDTLKSTSTMQHINTTEILTSLPTRLSYLQSFLLFDPTTDGALIHACKPVLGPLVGTIVDAVYDHLLKFDVTAAPFAQAQTASQQTVGVGEIHRDHANIKHRKDFLRGYLVRLASNTDWTPDSKFWVYLDGVGKAHTGGVGDQSGLKHRKNKPPLWVEYRDINLLLGWCENAVVDIVMAEESLDVATKVKVVKALNKFWWIQNDLFARHYVVEGDLQGSNKGMTEEESDGSLGGIWGMLGYKKPGHNL
jgi:hypothetical protein